MQTAVDAPFAELQELLATFHRARKAIRLREIIS